MSGYKVEEPEDEVPTTYNNFTVEEPGCEPVIFEASGKETEQYWLYYSKQQRKRFQKVINQMKDTWYDVARQIEFLIREGGIDYEKCEFLWTKMHKLFITEHRYKIKYYNDENMRLRKQKGYLNKKINKLRNKKDKL
jgi:hypothetical protein